VTTIPSPKPAPATGESIRRRPLDLRFAGWIAANCLGLNAIVYFLVAWIKRRALLPGWLLDSNFQNLIGFLKIKQGQDSWGAMLIALHYWQQHPGSSIYRGVFFDLHTKFQYPLTSLLPYIALKGIGLSEHQISIFWGAVDWSSVLLTGLVCVGIASWSVVPRGSEAAKLDYATIAAILVGTLLFYPLLKGCVIGQIQTVLSFFYALAFYCWLRGKERLAGGLLGLMVLVKPQIGLLLLWFALRKRWGALVAGLATAAAVLPFALVLFGWKNNWDYLLVLSSLSRVGESMFANHSMNGVLNRLLFNGGVPIFHQDSFPPFHPVVYAGTLLSSLFLIGLALIFPGGRGRRGGVADFACMTVVATIASPIAWQHHYGVFLPILVWLWFGRKSGQAPVRNSAWVITAYVLISDCLSPINFTWNIPVLNIVQSHIYFGGLMVLWILLSPRYRDATAGKTAADSHAGIVPGRPSAEPHSVPAGFSPIPA
jgi:alpha-1,2-mannosyltransferase